jgi:hypothetical protein
LYKIKNMEIAKVYSPVADEKIRVNLNDSPIWKGLRYTAEELEIAKAKHPVLYEYSFKFDGLVVIQLTGIKKLTQ